MRHKVKTVLPTLLKSALILLIFGVAIFQRIQLFDQTGKDIYAYERAVEDLFNGTNPYKWTIESFSNPDDPSNHGFAYLPGLIYTHSVAAILHYTTGFSLPALQKIPVLLADIGVGVILLKLLKKSYLASILGLLVWFFNPYFFLKSNYVFSDPLPIFFMLLATFYLSKDDVLSGSFFAVSIALKTFPYILFPIFLLKSKDKMHFLVSGAMVGLFVSLPFLGDLQTYLGGSVLVHGERFIQGRPFLFYISYFYDVELFQIIPFKTYTYLASFSGWFVTTLLILLEGKNKLGEGVLKNVSKDKYILGTISFLLFYIFTPVLNRTYLIWFIPLFVVGSYRFAGLLAKSNNLKFAYYTVLVGVYWGFYYWYLSVWKDGFHIWRP